MRRTIVIPMLILAVVAMTVVFNPLSLLPSAEVEAGPPLRETGVVSIKALTSTFEAEEGNLVFVDARDVTDPQPGTVGWIAEPETAVSAGDVLYVRDLQPVVLLAGDVPAWRTMSVDDVGADVAQLEANLLALGYGTVSEFTVDDTFTAATASVVERWQADLGVEQTGSVLLGDVVFGPAEARIGSVSATVGDPTVGSTLMVLSSPNREVVFTVGAESVGFIAEGTEVTGRLPDRSTVEATVLSIDPVGGGLSQVTAGIDDVEGLPLGDAVPVTVSWDQVLVSDATTVPSSALIRLDSGRYALEVVDQPGTTRLALVDVGDRFGTDVQILSDVEPNQTIIAP